MLLSEKQREFCQNMHHRWNFKGGATRSGKTYLDFRWIIPIRIRERVGKDGLAVILGVTKSTIERNVLEPMRKLYGADLVGSISSDNTAWIFGEKCYCLGAEKVSQVSKLRGASIKYCYGDEVADWSEEVFSLLKSRLDKEYSCFDGTFNPKYPTHWLKVFLDSDADIFSQTYTLDDNPFLPESFKENLKKEYFGTVFYDRYILGKWVLAEGLIYPMFTDNCIVDPKDRHYEKYVVSMDYGIQNPTAMLLWGLSDGVWYQVDEYYHSGRETNEQKTDQEYYDALCELVGNRPARELIIDPSASSFIALVNKNHKFRVRKAVNDVLPGIQHVASCLQDGKIKVCRSCKRTIEEYGLYAWDECFGEDRPIKDNDHCLTGDTLVDTLEGQKRIDELVGTEGIVYCTDSKSVETRRFHDVRMTREEAEIFEITLQNGKKVKATAEHPFLTKRGWVQLKDLRTDDEVACIGGIYEG